MQDILSDIDEVIADCGSIESQIEDWQKVKNYATIRITELHRELQRRARKPE